MRIVLTSLLLLLPVVAPAAAPGILHVFGYDWSVPNSADWTIDRAGGVPVLHLITPRNPLPGPRRPIQFALADTPAWSNVTVEADVQPLDRSLMIVFSYRDAAHFNYAHLSIDTGLQQPMQNGVFHVYGGERVRISAPEGPPAFAASRRWYHIRLQHNGETGAVSVTVDGKAIPALHAVDVSLLSGKVGVGSFDETADFRNVRISAN